MKNNHYFIFIVLVFLSFKMESGSTKYNAVHSFDDKEKYLLENIGYEIILKNKDFIKKRNKIKKCKSSLLLKIVEEEGKFNGFKCYSVCFSDRGLLKNHLPTYLCKKEGVYIAFYLASSKSLSIENIPKKLFMSDDCIRYEASWLILICNESYKYKVIDRGMVPFGAVKQFQEFSCEGNEKSDKMKTPIEIEKPIVDTVILRKLYNGEKVDW